MSSFVRYIERVREYYLPQYKNPYKWAHFDDVPFAPLKKPLAESRVVLISTSEITEHGAEREAGEDRQSGGGVYTINADVPVEKLYSPTHSYDKYATTMEDVGSFYPTAALHEAVKSGRIGSLTKRFHGVYNAYSQRRTRETDVVEALRRCREDGADVAVLTPVWPVCHQTVSLVARHLEANGIPTVVFAAARDIVEHCGVPRLVHTDFPLGSPCGEPHNAAQQREILEMGFKLLERAFVPRTTMQTPYKWSKGEAWKDLVFTPEQPFQTPEVEKEWLERKEHYRKLKAEGKR